jgi:hypothetical protein
MTALPAFVDLAAVADVLDELGHEIEQLGAALCRDPAFAAFHIGDLQAIDHIAQKQHALAILMRADCPAEALAIMGLDDLRVRLSTPHPGN